VRVRVGESGREWERVGEKEKRRGVKVPEEGEVPAGPDSSSSSSSRAHFPLVGCTF
jgi:hypothetical protein